MIINVLEYLEKSAVEHPEKIAFSDENNFINYSKLLEWSRRLGSYILNSTNGAIRKPIVVFVDRNIDTLVSLMGIAQSGNFYVPIDSQMPDSMVRLIFETLKPIAILVMNSNLENFNKFPFGICSINFDNAINYSINNEHLNKIRESLIDTDPLYATFTSGSTGVPKGVITSHRSVVDMTEALIDTFSFNNSNVFGNQNPFYFDASIKDIFSTIKCGATMHIIPKSCFIFPAQLVKFLNQKEIDTILWSASAIGVVANTHAFEDDIPKFLKQVLFSGEVMHNRILNYWRKYLPQTRFVNLYGPTEITSVCTFYIVDRQFSDDEVLPIGIAFRNTEVLLLNKDNKEVRSDEIGEICVRGCCLALGYYNNPEKTKESFCQNPLNSHYPELIYHTGDLAKYNSNGQIIFLSRKDNQVKHMGHRVELGEIEIIVNSLGLIDIAVCFYDHKKQKIIVVYRGENASKKYILDQIKDLVPKYMYPNIIINEENLPYNINGKIDRTLLKSMYYEGILI